MTKEKARNERKTAKMGMAASQARLLSITSRMADNELRAQLINNSKMRLASESSKVSEQYIQALNDATMMITNYNTVGEEQYQNLTFNSLTAYSSYNNQYALINNNGNIFVSEAEDANFKTATTLYPTDTAAQLKEFLRLHGLEEKTTYFEQFKDNISSTNGFTVTTNTGTYTFSDIKSVTDLEKMYVGSKNGNTVEHYGYDVLTSRTSYNELKSLQTAAQNSFNNMYEAMTPYIENTVRAYLSVNQVTNTNTTLSDTNKTKTTPEINITYKKVNDIIKTDEDGIPELDTSATYNKTTDTDYSKLEKLYNSLNTVYQMLGNKCYIDSTILNSISSNVKDSNISDLTDENGNKIISNWTIEKASIKDEATYNAVFNKLNTIYKSIYADPTSFISNYQRLFDDSNITTYMDPITVKTTIYNIYHKNEDGTKGEKLNDVEMNDLEKQDAEGYGTKINDEGNEESCDQDDEKKIFVYDEQNNITSLTDKAKEKYILETEEKEITQSVRSTDYYFYNQLYTSLVYATDSDANTGSNIDQKIYGTESPNINWDTDYVNAQWIANKKIIEALSNYTFNGTNLTATNNFYYATNTNFDITRCWDLLGTYATLGNSNLSDEAKEIKDAVILDAIFDVYGEPYYTWCDNTDTQGAADADAKVQWYTNLFNHMKETNYTTLENGLASSTEWITYALESGLATIQQTDKNNQWKGTLYSNIAEITEVTDNAAVAKAEAEYNKAMNNIEAKDKRFDVELKNIDTEHTSLQTEYESVKSVISKNIERSFKMYS